MSAMRPISHCTHKRALCSLALYIVAMFVATPAGPADIGYGLLVGDVANIVADLLTIAVCPLLYPSDRADYAFLPAVKTGGLSEAVILLPILRLILGSPVG